MDSVAVGVHLELRNGPTIELSPETASLLRLRADRGTRRVVVRPDPSGFTLILSHAGEQVAVLSPQSPGVIRRFLAGLVGEAATQAGGLLEYERAVDGSITARLSKLSTNVKRPGEAQANDLTIPFAIVVLLVLAGLVATTVLGHGAVRLAAGVLAALVLIAAVSLYGSALLFRRFISAVERLGGVRKS